MENAKWDHRKMPKGSTSKGSRKRGSKKKLRAVHDHKIFQTTVALTILANFVCSMVQLQIEIDEENLRVSYMLDVIFTVIFLVELLFNMATHWVFAF